MSIEKAYDSWSAIYDSNHNATRDLDKKVSQDLLMHSKYRNILEIGCGTGKNTSWLMQLCSRIDAVDFSENMLAVAKSKIQDERVHFHKLDIKHIWPFETEYYHLISCNLVLEHISDLQHIFLQAYDKIAPGGMFFVCELHPIKQYLGSKARYETEDGIQELEVYTHNVSDFFNAARDAGFHVSKIDEWFDIDKKYPMPRLISFIFKKP